MSILRIRLPELGAAADPTAAWHWALIGSDGKPERTGSTAQLSDLPRADRVEAILPAGMVLLTNAELPPVRGQKLRQLLPFAVEDKIVQDPEMAHVAAGTRAADGSTALAVVDKAWLQEQLDALSKAGVGVEHAWVETLLPPLEPGSWTVVWQGLEGFVRTGAQQGFALNAAAPGMPPLELIQALKAAQDGDNPPPQIVLRVAAGSSNAPNPEGWSQVLATTVMRDREWDLAQSGVIGPGAIDMLQGDFAPSWGAKELWPRLKPAAVLLGLIAALQVGATAFDWWRLSRDHKQVRAQIEKSFRSVFPVGVMSQFPADQVKRELTRLRSASGETGAGDFLALLERASFLLRAQSGVTVKSMGYEQGSLRVDVVLPDLGSVEALKSRLQSEGASARVEGVNQKSDGSAQARVVVTANRA